MLALRLRRGASPVQRAAWEVLCAPLKDHKRHLVGQFLLRRLAFIVVSVFSPAALGEAYGLLLLSVVFAVVDYWTAPFRHAAVQHVSTVAQLALVIIAAGNVLTVAESEQHVDSNTLSAVTGLTLIALASPVAVALASFCTVSIKPTAKLPDWNLPRVVRSSRNSQTRRDSELALVFRELMFNTSPSPDATDCNYRSRWLASHWRTLALKLLDGMAQNTATVRDVGHTRPYSDNLVNGDVVGRMAQVEAERRAAEEQCKRQRVEIERLRMALGRLSSYQCSDDDSDDPLPPPPPPPRLVVSFDEMCFEPELAEDVHAALLSSHPDAQADHVIV
mmetsp:Transcript_43250/g.93909  ORF Transcript_43250/g.93909 Transcript_43250/m.93909 type:complete len:333 (-) Transcript_43250:69-1067(-)